MTTKDTLWLDFIERGRRFHRNMSSLGHNSCVHVRILLSGSGLLSASWRGPRWRTIGTCLDHSDLLFAVLRSTCKSRTRNLTGFAFLRFTIYFIFCCLLLRLETRRLARKNAAEKMAQKKLRKWILFKFIQSSHFKWINVFFKKMFLSEISN